VQSGLRVSREVKPSKMIKKVEKSGHYGKKVANRWPLWEKVATMA